MRIGPPPVLSTLLACCLVLGGFGLVAGRLTDGFERWTFEELRRASAARGELRFPSITLRDSRGDRWQPFNDATASAYLVDFIYTRCPSVCQALGSEFHQAQEALRQAPRNGVRLVSVSIDPLRDDTSALAEH
ncbi:SCO family protein, partial [Pelomonas sp. HMWF004]